MAKAAKVAIALVILAIIMAILYLTGAVVSREPYWSTGYFLQQALPLESG